MTEVSKECFDKMEAKMENIMKNFKILHNKQKNNEEKIANLEKYVESLEEKIKIFAKNDYELIEDLQSENMKIDKEIMDINKKLVNLDKEYSFLKESISMNKEVPEINVSDMDVIKNDIEDVKKNIGKCYKRLY